MSGPFQDHSYYIASNPQPTPQAAAKQWRRTRAAKKEHERNQRRTNIPRNRRIQPRKHNVTIPEMLGPALRDQQLPDLGGHRRGLLPVRRLPIRLALRPLRRPHRDELKVRMLCKEEGKSLSYAAGAAQYPAFSLRKARCFGGEGHDDWSTMEEYNGRREGPR